MRFLKAIFAFLITLIVTWCVITFGFALLTDYWHVLKVSSLEGANAMGVAFMIAPLCGILLGLIVAVRVFIRAGRAKV